MGYDLKNSKGGYRRFNLDRWWFMFDLAKRHGWTPQGTVVNDDPDWDGRYFGNEFQWVTEEDARNMADALERAVEEPEEGDKEFVWVTKGEPGEDDKIDCVFSNRYVAEFAWFCRQGEFRIL